MTTARWLFRSGALTEEFRTKRLALAWIKAEGWKPWAGKRELIVFVRGIESAALRRKSKQPAAMESVS
jgi:hypothetical protein